MTIYAKRIPFFMAKIREDADCWVWAGSLDKDGYGSFYDGAKTVRAHRFAYEAFVGPIPPGLEIDHKCRREGCVNPAHLEPVPRKINNLRSRSPSALQAAQTECKRGHPLSGANLLLKQGRRRCRECVNQGARKRRAATRETLPARMR